MVLALLNFPGAFVLAQAAPAAPQAPSMQPMLLMVGAIIALFYFIVLAPQKSEQKKRQKLIDSVAKGDRVVTIGGIHGSVEGVNASKGTVTVLIAPKVTVEVNRTALATVTPKAKPGAKDEAETA